MTITNEKVAEAGRYAGAYFAKFAEAAASVDDLRLQQAAEILTRIYTAGGMVYSCGNGGSASVANHLGCDHCKLVRTDTQLTPRIMSLSSSPELITAVANDISYDEVFVYQLSCLARPGDGLITISSSGDSENIVRAAQWAKDNDVPVISMTGFSGGRSADIADVNLHVSADNYGIIEDLHQSLMHILAQYICHTHIDNALVNEPR